MSLSVASILGFDSMICRELANGDPIDYCIVAFAIILIVSVVQWIIDGSKNFKGPRVDVT